MSPWHRAPSMEGLKVTMHLQHSTVWTVTVPKENANRQRSNNGAVGTHVDVPTVTMAGFWEDKAKYTPYAGMLKTQKYICESALQTCTSVFSLEPLVSARPESYQWKKPGVALFENC